ncbi:MAG: 50S ribosomal protein L1 [Candidatus Sumerlaeia bacterium]
MKRSKKYQDAVKLVDKTQRYSLEEAVALVRKMHYVNFTETFEIHVRLSVDPRNAEQNVRGTVELPHGTGKDVRVLVFAQGDNLKAAEAAGADFVGGDDLAEKIQGGWMDFDAVVATPDMMRVVGKLGRVLGPRGLMPNPKTGTVTFEVAQAVQSLKAGQVEYRLDRNAIIHASLGNMDFTDEQLVDNTKAYLDAIYKARPASLKGQYVRSIAISSSMSPSVKIIYQAAAA